MRGEAMSYECRVVLDSVAPCGKRLTTLCLTYPRIVHSEFMTHRDRARNSASSRAIPQAKMVSRIQEDPFVPLAWLSEQPGMQGGVEVDGASQDIAEELWLRGRDAMLALSNELAALGVHKSICNRVTEPWMWITVITTATEWQNFFRLRCHPDAEQHIRRIAEMAQWAMRESSPRHRIAGSWHLPFVEGSPDEHELYDWAEDRRGVMSREESCCRVSVARCARVSYLTHEGTRDPMKDLELYDKLVRGSGFGHWSPHEHVAFALSEPRRSGPFIGWGQYRKLQQGECADAG